MQANSVHSRHRCLSNLKRLVLEDAPPPRPTLDHQSPLPRFGHLKRTPIPGRSQLSLHSRLVPPFGVDRDILHLALEAKGIFLSREAQQKLNSIGAQIYTASFEDARILSTISGPRAGLSLMVDSIVEALDPKDVLQPPDFGSLPVTRLLTLAARRLFQGRGLEDLQTMAPINGVKVDLSESHLLSSGPDDGVEGLLRDTLNQRGVLWEKPETLAIKETPSFHPRGRPSVNLRSLSRDLIPDHHPHVALQHSGIFFPIPSESDLRSSGLPLVESLLLLQTLLGHGSEFTTGGPGNGLTTWLYQNVLPLAGVLSCSVQHCVSLKEEGLFGIIVSAEEHRGAIERSTALIHSLFSNWENLITGQSLEKATKQITVKALSSPILRDMDYVRLMALSPSPNALETELDRLWKVSPDEVIKSLEWILKPENMLQLEWR